MTSGKVLVVDDDPDIRDLLCEILALYDFEANGGRDGAEGLRLARQWRPQAIVLDLMLPDINGYEVCRELRSDEGADAVGILLLTCMQGHADRVRGFQAGADRFVTKPFNPDVVVAELRSLIGATNGQRKIGLRRERELDVTTEKRYRDQVHVLLKDLSIATPLDLDDIEATGQALLEVGRPVALWRREHPFAGAVALTCRIFVDRIEFALNAQRSAPQAGTGACESDIQPCESARTSDWPELLTKLGDDVRPSDHGTVVTATRHFSIPEAV